MKNYSVATVLFNCPQCNVNFEFDAVGENEFVPCPVCGTHFVTVKAGNKVKLEAVEQALVC